MGGATFCILGSSSAGNCALLATPGCRVLIDAGFPARRLDELLAGAGLALRDLDAIFLTHEHGDHAAGIGGLARHPQVRVFANRDTAQSVQQTLRFRPAWHLFETGATFQFRDLEITSFSLPHDAADPVGFLFTVGGRGPGAAPRRLAWCTDLGHVTALVRERVRAADVLVLESNYDPAMLDESRRPWALKQRIKGRHGHLSNDAAHDLLRTTEQPAWERVFLAHLSRECNDVGLVQRTFATLGQNGGGHRFSVEVIDPAPRPRPAVALTEV